MKYVFVINPVAGKGKSQHNIIKNIHEQFLNIKKDYEIYITKYKGDAKNFVTKKCEELIPIAFFACGGDGTLHEVVNAACKYKHVIVGVIPCGSGNDFVRNFHNSMAFHDIYAQIEGEMVSIDLIKIKDEYSVSVCNIGLDADAAFNMDKFKKIPFISGTGCYILSVLYCLFNKLGKNLEVEFDSGEKISNSFLLGVIANGNYYGGGYKCAPLAEVNDGILDICFVKKISRLKILTLLKSYKEGSHLENKKIKQYITYKKCKYVKIKSTSPINFCIDGENFIYDDLELSVKPKSLNFWLPKGVSLINTLNKEIKASN